MMSWVARLWWTTTRRRWRNESGSPLVMVLFAAALFFATARTPAGGEVLYLSVVLGLGGAVLVLVPLAIPGESVLASRRFDLLPLSPGAIMLLRVGFSNPIRTFLTAVLLVWVAALPLTRELLTQGRVAELLQILAWVTIAVLTAQLVEDLLRYRRSIVVHQIVLFLGIATWPLTVEYLGDQSNFVPAPAWTMGPIGAVLIGSGRGFGTELGILIVLLATATSLLIVDRWLVLKTAGEPPPPPRTVRMSGGVARLLGRIGGRSGNALAKELTVPLRFLSLRAALIFTLLFAGGAFIWGLPLLLLTVPFWWQPLGSNLIGPDLPRGGIVRYHLAGWPLSRVFAMRHLAMVLLSTALVGAVALVMGIGGWIRPPVIGPPTLWAYPVVFVYAVTLVLLWAPAGDRYSLRYPDPQEMRVLVPPRRRSAGAGAMVLMLFYWAAAGMTGAALWLLAYLLSGGFGGDPLGAARLAAAFAIAALAHVYLYVLHLRTHAPRF